MKFSLNVTFIALILSNAGCATPCCDSYQTKSSNTTTAPSKKPHKNQQNTTNWSMLIALPNAQPDEKETTWYLDYDIRSRNIPHASSKQGRLLIQPFDKQKRKDSDFSSTIDIRINCYERNFAFGTIKVYSKPYAQGDIMEQGIGDSAQHFASPRNPIDTGIINFYCKD